MTNKLRDVKELDIMKRSLKKKLQDLAIRNDNGLVRTQLEERIKSINWCKGGTFSLR